MNLNINGFPELRLHQLNWGRKDICDVQNVGSSLCLISGIQELVMKNK